MASNIIEVFDQVIVHLVKPSLKTSKTDRQDHYTRYGRRFHRLLLI